MQIQSNYKGGHSIKHELGNKDVIYTVAALNLWVKSLKMQYSDLIIVSDGIAWMERYDDYGNEVPNYQYIFANVGIYMWIPTSLRFKLVVIEPVFDQLPKQHQQAVLSYVCCMANLEMEAFNEGLAPDDPKKKVFHL